MRRAFALLVAIAVIAVGAFAATAWIGGGGDAAPRLRRRRPARRRSRS